MASREFIEKRIAGKKAEIEKLEKKMARILVAEQSNWETNNPYFYGEYDKRSTTRELEAARKALEKYEKDLEADNIKAASRNVPAITEFLDRWQERMEKYYGDGLKEAHALSDKCREAGEAASAERWGTPEYEAKDKIYKELRQDCYNKLHGYFEEREVKYPGIANTRTYKKREKVRDGELEYVYPYMCRTLEESLAKVHSEIEKEKIRKYDFIIERTTEITGTITDATRLRVGAKGDLNGQIIGEKGTAKVQTIGAGGYNIQCFHFRTLINPMKERTQNTPVIDEEER